MCAHAARSKEEGRCACTRTKGIKPLTPMHLVASTLLEHADSMAVCSMFMCSGPTTTMTMPQHWAAQGRRVSVVPPSPRAALADALCLRR